MKQESTIKRQMNELYRIAKEEQDRDISMRAYDYATALQWVTQDCTWNLVGWIKRKQAGKRVQFRNQG